MNKEAIYHRATNQYAYGYDRETIHIILQAKKGDLTSVELRYGDPYQTQASTNHWLYQTIPMKKSGSSDRFDYWFAAVKPEFRRMRYGFTCTDQKESITFTEKGFYHSPPTRMEDYFCFPYLHEMDVHRPPAWVKDTVWYQIFPERFANGDASINPPDTKPWASEPPASNNFFGGDLQGVINHLDYLQELGINGIYFTPIFKAYSNHKYDTIDYMEIDPQFGDNQTFKQLVQECHKRGIRVMLDAVFNHSGFYWEPWQDVLRHQENSRYRDWFHIWDFPIKTDPQPNYDTFSFVASMPKLNTANPEVKQYLLQVARYWVEEFDIDAWRLDVANEIDHQFWREFRQVVKAVKPDAYILGEIWHDSMTWLQSDQFDAVMNYPFTNEALQFFAKNEIGANNFANSLTDVQHMYPANVNEVNFNLLDSHDTPRILTEANGKIDRVKLLYVLQLSFIGTPCIYYGDEIGMSGGEDPGCRACMVWDKEKQNNELFAFVRQLIALRKSTPAFGNHATFRFLQADDTTNTIVYQKATQDDKLIFVLNNRDTESVLTIDALRHATAEELFSEETVTFAETAQVQLPAYGYRCYRVK